MEEGNVSSRMDNEIQIISLNGRVTYDYTGKYKDEIKGSIQSDKSCVLDLIGVTQIDSTGIGLIVNVAKYYMTNNKRIVLVIENEMIKELFVISKLDQIFKICASVDEAKKVLEIPDEMYWQKIEDY